MNEILVAIDGSGHSEKVVSFTIGLAKATSSKIVMLFVAQPIKVPDEYAAYAKSENLPTDSYYDRLAQGLFDNMGRLLAKGGVPYEAVSVIGNPTQCILDMAKSRKVSLMVLGVHGLHRLGKIRALGSTSRRVIENSDVPVVLVR